MKTMITRIKRLALALCFATPVVSWAAVDYTGTDYEPWSYSAGCVAWRATSGQLFHASTVADVDENGDIGTSYTLTNGGAHPWQVFASNQSQYTFPGKVLVFDGAGYNNNSDAQFAPMSFGGMWVKALQAEDTPYCITDTTSSSARQVELGATNSPSYFKFDESFTFDRNSATKVLGTATVEIASGKTFTINKRAGKGAVVEAGNTLVLKGAGTLAVVGGLSVDGTLDLSATTRPTIAGNVTLAGTIVLPAGTEVSPESPFTVCTGTLSGLNVLVKIGDAEAVEKSFTAENGAITSFGDPIYEFSDNFPTVVPAGQTYTFIGGETAETAVTVPSTVSVSGTLKTKGFINITYWAATTDATLDVINGTTRLNCGDQAIAGYVTVREGATLVNEREADAITYDGTATTVNVYGTVDMGNTRWTLNNVTINMYGGTITGAGQGTNGALDFIDAASSIKVHFTSTIPASIKFRNQLTPIVVNADQTITLSGVIRKQSSSGGVRKQGAGNLTFTTSPDLPGGITHEDGHLVFNTEDDVTVTTTYTALPSETTSLWYARQENWKGTVVIGALSAPTALPLDTYGNANSKIVLAGTTGNCYLNGTTTVAAELVVGTEAESVVEFNNGNSGQVGTFSKVSGPGTLKLVGWTGCSGATYNLNAIDNFDGLAVANNITRQGGGTLTIGIGDILTTRTTNPGDCVLPIANTAVDNATGTVVYNLANAKVNGNTLDLEAKSDGIYVVVPTAPAARIGETEYTTVGEALTIGYSRSVGTVVEVLDDTFVWPSEYDAYFLWNEDARTATRTTDQASAAKVIADSAEAAIALVTGSVARPKAVESYVSAEAYAGYFTKVAKDNKDGTWNVSSVLDKAKVLDAETTTLTETLAGVLDSEATTITLTAKPGLYYSFKSGTVVTSLTEGTRVLAETTSVTLNKVKGDTFYQVVVNTTAE